jgi:hypothetical protein
LRDKEGMMNNNLARYNHDPEDFEARIVTGDETWIYYWEPESKRATRQWKHKYFQSIKMS